MAQDQQGKKKQEVFSPKPKGEKGKSNKRQLRRTRFKTRNKQGDKFRKGDITGRKIKRKRSEKPPASVPAFDPYLGRKNQGDKQRIRTKYSGGYNTTPRQRERVTRRDISGRRLRPTTTPSRIVRAKPNAARSLSGRSGRIGPNNPNVRRLSVRQGNRANSFKRNIRGVNTASRRGEIRGNNKLSSYNTISGTIRNKRPNNPFAVANTKRKRRGEKAWKNDITGRRFRDKKSPRQSITPNNTSPFANTRPRGDRSISNKKEKANVRNSQKKTETLSRYQFGGYESATRRGERYSDRDIAGRKLRTRETRSRRPTFSELQGYNPYWGRKSKREVAKSNKKELRNLRLSQRRPEVVGGTFKGYQSITKRGENYTNRDIAGKKLRTRNSVSARPLHSTPTFNPYRGRPRNLGDGPSIKTKGQNRVFSVGRNRWNNKGRSIATKPPGPGTLRGSKFQGNITPFRNYRNPDVTTFSGDLNRKRKPIGGGSISGRLLNNKGRPIAVKPPGPGTLRGSKFQGNITRLRDFRNPDITTFSGDTKRKPTPLGGGSISGRLRNNKGRPIAVKPPGPGTLRGSKFQGNITRLRDFRNPDITTFSGDTKRKPTPIGGGSISGRLRNNKGRPIAVKPPGPGTLRGSKFQGNIAVYKKYRNPDITTFAGDLKQKRKPTGGGSITRLRNNDGKPIAVKPPGPGTLRGSKFQGNIAVYKKYRNPDITTYSGDLKRKRKPIGGGGSITRLRNNDGKPIAVKPPGPGTLKGSKFQGNIAVYKKYRNPDITTFRGDLRLKRKPTGGGGSIARLRNNDGKPIAVKSPGPGTIKGSKYRGDIAIHKKYRNPDITTYRGDLNRKKIPTPSKGPYPGYRNIRQNRIEVFAKKNSIKFLERPFVNTKGQRAVNGPNRRNRIQSFGRANNIKFLARVGTYKQKAGPVVKKNRRLIEYVPGVLRADRYRGGVKMKNSNRKGLHPSSAFARSNTNSVEEKDKIFKFKIWFNQIFKSNKPNSQKEKNRRPRYDKGESEIWNK